MPIVLYDVTMLTNRLLGPLVRLRREMRRLAEGQRVEPFEFREKDFLREFATEFNSVAERMARLEDELETARVREFSPTAAGE